MGTAANPGSPPAEKKVLLYRLPPDLDDVRTGLLARSGFAIERVGAPDYLLRRLDSTPYKMLILNLPDGTLDMQDVLPRIRGEDRPCAHCIFILVTPANLLEDHRPLLGRGLNAVLPATVAPAALEAAITWQVQALPRLDARCAVRLKAVLPRRPAGICQTRDLSASGMFLISREARPVGENLRFELTLPLTRVPISGTAVVVRRAVPGRERFEGFAVTFTSFSPGARESLLSFLDRKKAGAGPFARR